MKRSRVLYLARHGELAIDEHRRFIGQMDIPLSARGREQARGLGQICCRFPIAQIYCSDLSRSRETAALIADDVAVPVIEHSGLREISLGLWEGCEMADIAKRYRSEFNRRGEDLEHYRPPGGESFADCRLRVLAALEDILTGSSRDILIAGHAGVNRVILCHALGIPLANVFRIGQTYGCLNILECRAAGYCVKLLNFTSPEAKVSHERSAVEAEPVTVI